ncbi:peptide/nickel transport system substrate-binding protein [Ochrobactrum daejeonense]|uniref:Peptide/nickel transport system substrate-binding protein n=1 Tax=Brucella daejeonensis TaxID=659015 RepID=A0A7W9AZE1_9HYPH|nr:ABC transporter substrate-binding protein [Brucella daejeonensis]MBB5703267.1 peptide/nickel transport system substrate-binding protein [Brucella daejeonensis]
MKPLYLALAAGLALSGVAATAMPAAAQSTLNIALQDDPDTLDPVSNWSFVGRHVLQSLCDKIVDIDEKGQIIPMLATSWEWNADSTALTLKLRKDALFHDGTKVDAAAVKYNLERGLNAKISRRKAEISAIGSIDVVDDATVKINLKEPSVPLLAALSDRAGMIVSPKAGEALGDKFTEAPVCSGPYKFKERVTQDHITLEKFADYYNADQFHFDELVYRGMPDSSVRLLNLRSGQADLIERLAATDVESVKADKGLTVDPVIGLGYYGITFNITGEGANLDASKKAAIREAFSLAIDRDAISSVVFDGQASTGNQPFPPSSAFYDKNFPVPARDLDAAKKKMEEAGVKSVDLEILVPTDAERQQVIQLIQAMVQEIGINVSIKPTELMTLLDVARQGKFEAHLVGWSGRVDPDLNITPMLACGAAGNDAHYCNKDLDAILTKARSLTDTEARKAEYSKAMAILLKDLPIVYLYHSQWIFAHNSNLTGFKPAPDGIIRLNGVSRKS